jgi:hypothetical protein
MEEQNSMSSLKRDLLIIQFYNFAMRHKKAFKKYLEDNYSWDMEYHEEQISLFEEFIRNKLNSYIINNEQ